jgi:outer membrane receptor protein involved in Fe transport
MHSDDLIRSDVRKYGIRLPVVTVRLSFQKVISIPNESFMSISKKYIFKRHPLNRLILAGFSVASASLPLVGFAQSNTNELPEVKVIGTPPSVTQVTDDAAALPASTTVLGRRDFDRKDITTYGDIYRGITGVSVAEYGQGLVAYEIKFRGFASGHGRDVAAYLDGVPLNITGSQHTNGYMDQAQIIPELLERVEIVRGPFSAYSGNHAIAGSVQMFTDRNVTSSFKISADSFGRVRLLPIYSSNAGPGKLLLALELTKGSGYTQQSGLERANLFVRYSQALGDGTMGLRFQHYHADAQAPGYLDLARIDAGQINKRDALSRGIGDRKSQSNIVLNYRSNDLEGLTGWGSGWSGSVYVVRDKRERFTNFDISLPSFSSGNLGAEQDRLQQFGLDARKVTSFASKSLPAQLAVGVQYNRERITALNYSADAFRNFVVPSAAIPDTVGVDRTVLTTIQSVYAQLQLLPISKLKVTLGLRYDKLDFGVDLRPQDDTFTPAQAAGISTSIQSSASKFSPKLGLAWTVFDGGRANMELYANTANGLKSPYAFSDFYGNVAANSPLVPNLTVSQLRSNEIGLKGRANDGKLRWRVGLWDTRQDSEVERNAAGFVQSFGRTDRKGFDLEVNLQLASATQLYANFSRVRARSLTAPVTANYLTNVPEWTASLGLSSKFSLNGGTLDLSIDDSIVGPQSITPDNLTRGSSYNRLSMKASYAHPSYKGTTFYAGLVAFSKQLEEPRFDFGGGAIGVSPRPRFALNIGTQITF